MSDYNLGTASGKIEIDGRAAAVGFKVAETAAGAFFDVIKNRVDQVQTLGKRMAAVGTAGTISFAGAIKVAASFEQQMSGVSAVVNGTKQEMDDLREKALQLGADTSFSASQAAEAIEELAKAGIPVADILNGAADGAVALAAAGGIGLAEAATISANAMNQFSLSADKIPEVADILAGVANTSAADVSSIGQSLSQAGAVANLAGLSFRDTAIAIGEMADAGINGSDAGTSLKTMLNNLIPVTDKQKAKFKELGLLTYNLGAANKFLAKEGLKTGKNMDQVRGTLSKYVEELGKGKVGTVRNAKATDELLSKNNALKNSFFDAQGNVKKLGGLQGTLAKALKGMTKEQKLSTLEVLFGADAMRATAILSLEGAAGYKEFSKAVGQTTAADVAKERLNNLSGSIEAFKGSMETALITIGSIFLPAVTKIVQGATAMVNAFNGLPGPIKIAIGVFAAITSAGLLVFGMILALLPVILSMVANFLLMRGISAATSAIKAFYAAAKGGQGVMAASSAANTAFSTSVRNTARRTAFATKIMYGLTRATYLLGAALKAALLNPYVLALLALVAIGILLYKKFKPFRDLVDGLVSALKDKLAAAWQALQPVIAAALAGLKDFGNFIKANLLPVLKTIGQELLGKLMSAVSSITDAFKTQLMPALTELGGLFTGTVLPALKKVGEFLLPIIKFVLKLYAVLAVLLFKAWMLIGGIMIKYVLPILLKIAGFLGGVLIDTIVEAVKGIIQAVKGIVQIFSGLIDFFAGLFTGDWGRMWEGIKSIFTGVFNLIIGALRTYLAVGMLKIVGLGFKLLKGVVMLGWRVILNLFKLSGRLIVGAVKLPFKLVYLAIKLYLRLWLAIIRGAWAIIRGVFTRALGAIRGGVSGAFNGIKNIISNVIGSVKTFLSNAWSTIKNTATTAFDTLKTSVETALQAVVTFVTGLPAQLLTALGDLGTLFLDAGKKLIQGLIDGIKSMAGPVGSAIGGIAKGIGKFLPGSPIKEGPLRSWNRGGAGKRLGQLLADGIDSSRSTVEGSMNALTSGLGKFNTDVAMSSSLQSSTAAMSTALGMGTKASVGSVVAPVKAKRGTATTGTKRSRIIDGELVLRNGRAYIQGIAEDVVASDKSFQARSGRRKRDD